MASDVQICNLALLEFGSATILSLNDNTNEGRTCKAYYEMTRDELIYIFPWNFAMKRVILTPEAVQDTETTEYDYKVTIPPDCLRVFSLFDSAEAYSVEGRTLYINQSEDVEIKYIAQITDSSWFNPLFVRCFVLLMAIRIAPKLAGNSSKLKQVLVEQLKDEILNAFRINALEGNPAKSKDEQPLDLADFTWSRR